MFFLVSVHDAWSRFFRSRSNRGARSETPACSEFPFAADAVELVEKDLQHVAIEPESRDSTSERPGPRAGVLIHRDASDFFAAF